LSRSDTAGLFCSAVAQAEHGRSDLPRRVPLTAPTFAIACEHARRATLRSRRSCL
jgi:hypothetical protein